MNLSYLPFWLDGVAEFPVITVADDAANLPEQLGTKRKFWFKDGGGTTTLFKQSRENTGEHWSEKIACELASLLGIPHAHYDLGVWQGRDGVVSPTFVPEQGRLVHGNEMLFRIVESYNPQTSYSNSYHTVKFVMRFLAGSKIRPPISLENDRVILSAADSFVGYLMLDAWIGNTDRHHENWAICLSIAEGARLAPSYDHASCLGRIETQEKKMDILTTKDMNRNIEKYCSRARSALFRDISDKKPISPIDAFHEAAMLRPTAATYWLGKLMNLDQSLVNHVLRLIPAPTMTELDRTFAASMLNENMRKLKLLAEI